MTTLPRDADWPEPLRGVVPREKVEFAVRARRLVSLPLARSNKGVGYLCLVLTLALLYGASRGIVVDVQGWPVRTDAPWVMGGLALLGLGVSGALLGFAYLGPRLPGRFYVASAEGLVESRRGGYVVWPWREFEKVEVGPDATVTLSTFPRVVGQGRDGGKPSTTVRHVELVEVPAAEAIAARCRELMGPR